MQIIVDDLTSPEIRELLVQHLVDMSRNSPPESMHALNLEQLRRPEMTFWSAWDDGKLAGCGALKELDKEHGEIKSMRTVPSYRRRGVASNVVTHIMIEAKRRNYRRLSLETGSMDAFLPARKLYTKFGFKMCKPFSDYVEDPNSVFMTREL